MIVENIAEKEAVLEKKQETLVSVAEEALVEVTEEVEKSDKCEEKEIIPKEELKVPSDEVAPPLLEKPEAEGLHIKENERQAKAKEIMVNG